MSGAPLPSAAGKKAAAAKKKPPKKAKKRKNTPKYKDMIVRAIKALKEPNGCTPQAIAKYIEFRYKKRNDFVIKHVINWMVSEHILCRCKGRVKIAPKKKKPKAAKQAAPKGKKKGKRKGK